jgi:hypothetical protein
VVAEAVEDEPAVAVSPEAAVAVSPEAAVAVSPEAAVAVIHGRAEETTPDPGEVMFPGHLHLREVLIVPVWSVLAPGVPQICSEQTAVEFLPETRFRALGLPGNAWPTARLNYHRRGGSTVPTSIGPRTGPGLGKGSPIGRATGTSAIS